jgi:hypothetical protein
VGLGKIEERNDSDVQHKKALLEIQSSRAFLCCEGIPSSPTRFTYPSLNWQGIAFPLRQIGDAVAKTSLLSGPQKILDG